MALILRNGGSQSPDRWLREPRNNHLHQGEGIQVEEVMLETGNIHHPAEEAVKVIFIGHRPMNGRKVLDSPGITGLVQK